MSHPTPNKPVPDALRDRGGVLIGGEGQEGGRFGMYEALHQIQVGLSTDSVNYHLAHNTLPDLLLTLRIITHEALAKTAKI